jgi:hypothetical protein
MNASILELSLLQQACNASTIMKNRMEAITTHLFPEAKAIKEKISQLQVVPSTTQATVTDLRRDSGGNSGMSENSFSKC